MSSPKVPPVSSIVAGGPDDTFSAGKGGGEATPDAAGSLGDAAGKIIGGKVGGQTGAAIGGAVGKAVASAVLGGSTARGALNGLGGATGGFAGPLGGGASGLSAVSTGGFAGPLADVGKPPPANSAWFTFRTQQGDFAVYAFSGEETVSRPYEFFIELVSRSSNVDIVSLLGTPACLSITDRSGGTRLVHGLISEMQQLHTANRFTHYRCTIAPRLWFLDKIRDHRIFQELSVVDIIQKILKEAGFTAEDYSFKLFYEYEPREYCVQYGETYLHFISRICEEEGVYFYFEHTESTHCLCFCDREGGPKIAGNPALRFFPGSGSRPDTAVIARLKLRHQVNSNAAVYRDWNFEKPRLDLTVKDQENDPEKAPRPPGMRLEHYQYPHLYQLRAPGEKYAKLQVMRQLTFSKWVECQSDVSRYLPSYTFTVHSHPREEVNEGWWVYSVRHEGEQPAVLEHEAPDERSLNYRSHVTAIPEMVRFVPALEHPKSLVPGQQTALVTGPEGEEIYPDKYGRVKVQFFWDREGKWNEKTTCWIRVSQGWAGSQYGTMAIPRVGHEVIVSFLEGNPDRPLVTGRVFHALNMPPYALPDNKTRTVFKSLSSPGGGGYNELRVEDKKGEEEIYLHAEKDVNAHVKNDWKDYVIHDRHATTDNFTYVKTKGETHEMLEGERKTEVFANDNLTVHAERHETIDDKWLVKVGDEVHIKAGTKVVIEAGAELTIRGAGSFIKLDASGIIEVGGKIKLNCGGSPGEGSGSSPVPPDPAMPVDASFVPGEVAKPPEYEEKDPMVEALEQAGALAQPLCDICEPGGA